MTEQFRHGGETESNEREAKIQSVLDSCASELDAETEKELHHLRYGEQTLDLLIEHPQDDTVDWITELDQDTDDVEQTTEPESASAENKEEEPDDEAPSLSEQEREEMTILYEAAVRLVRQAVERRGRPHEYRLTAEDPKKRVWAATEGRRIFSWDSVEESRDPLYPTDFVKVFNPPEHE